MYRDKLEGRRDTGVPKYQGLSCPRLFYTVLLFSLGKRKEGKSVNTLLLEVVLRSSGLRIRHQMRPNVTLGTVVVLHQSLFHEVSRSGLNLRSR